MKYLKMAGVAVGVILLAYLALTSAISTGYLVLAGVASIPVLGGLLAALLGGGTIVFLIWAMGSRRRT